MTCILATLNNIKLTNLLDTILCCNYVLYLITKWSFIVYEFVLLYSSFIRYFIY